MEDIEVERIRVLPPWFTPEAKPHGGKPAAARNMEAACTRGAALDYSDANRLGRHRGEYTPRQGAQKRVGCTRNAQLCVQEMGSPDQYKR